MPSTFRSVSLRPVVDDDLPFLFRLFADPDRSHLWMRGRAVLDEAGFERAWEAWTSSSIAAKFIVESSQRPAGLVFDHDRTIDDGWTKVTTLLLQESVGRGAGVIATALFKQWLFESLPFRKIYHEVYGYNPAVIRIWRKLGFREEAVLKEDRFWNGKYWDLHFFAVYREDWPTLRARILRERKSPRRAVAGQAGANGKEVSAAAAQ
jgi:RimJ/RimL family protein N-acetyltransferase